MKRFLFAAAPALVALTGPVSAQAPSRLPMLANAEAWRRLPGAPEHEQPLPGWARALAGPMPLTTARMLELDALHRSGDRLDAQVRCLVRWSAADANGCAYSKAVAAADLRRSRRADADLAELVAHPEKLPALDRAAIAFARKIMLEAHAVTDAEVRRLLDLAGEERFVALVTLLAHASFQDRVILALNVPPEKGGAVSPLNVVFVRPEQSHKPVAGIPKAPPNTGTPGPIIGAGPEWLQQRRGLQQQRERPGRIRVPSREEVLARIGKDHPSAWQVDINWSRVCFGYQPELTQAWFDCAAAFRQESSFSSVFSNSIFWVVTDALKCFY
jgi:alkylhydroperoxidase family enzyme